MGHFRFACSSDAGATCCCCGDPCDPSGGYSQSVHREAGRTEASGGSAESRRRHCRGRGVEGRGGLGRGANMAHNRDGGNPFAESGELDNPFQVTCAGLLWATGLTFLGPG